MLTDKKPLGLHITAIRKFIEDHPEAKNSHLTTSQLNSAYVKPETKADNQPYVQQYVNVRDDKTGMPLVSAATVFVSHAWRYVFYDVVVDVMEKYASENPDTYFWFDLFTNNQNEVATKDFDWFSSTFRDSIRNIGQVLLVLSPWNDPMPMKRAWCLFEIFNALEESEVKLSINLPGSEIPDLKAGVLADPDLLIQAISHIQAEKAEAKSDSDRELIFEVIQKSDGGFPHVDQQVNNSIRSWYIDQLQTIIQEDPENSTLLLHSATVMMDFGFLDQALHHFNESLTIDRRALGDNHSYIGDTYNNMGHLYKLRGELDQALEYYNKTLTIALNTGTDKSTSVDDQETLATIYNGIANVYDDKRENEKALEYHNKALSLRLAAFGEEHPDVAGSYNNLALVYEHEGEVDKSLEYHLKALSILEKTLVSGDILFATSYNNIGSIYDDKGEQDKALEYYDKALPIKLRTFGQNHPQVADLFYNMANAYLKKDDLDKALEYHSKSLAVTLNNYGENHSHTADSYAQIGNVFDEKDELDKALENYNKALSIRQNVFGGDDPKVADVIKSIGFIYEQQDRQDEALEYCRRALVIEQKALGVDHPEVQKTISTMEEMKVNIEKQKTEVSG